MKCVATLLAPTARSVARLQTIRMFALIVRTKAMTEAERKRRRKAYKQRKQAYARERYWDLKDRGFCVTCGSEYAMPGRCRCKACAEGTTASKNYAAWYDKYTGMRQERKDKGLCVNCGKPVVPGRRRCEKHLAQYRDYQRCYKLNKKFEKAR